jgi:hypothetical protein
MTELEREEALSDFFRNRIRKSDLRRKGERQTLQPKPHRKKMNDPRKATGAFRFIVGKPCRFWTNTVGNGFLMDNWGNLLPVPNIKTITE